MKVAIVGIGGVGSHVAQQLAYLGVKSFALIDKDVVSKSNLNRLIGAVEEHYRNGTLKVDVAADLIRGITPTADISRVPKSFISEDGFAHLREADYIFSCVDRDAARLILTEFCSAYKKPYIDIATDIGHDGSVWFGGRVVFSHPGEGCLSCMGVLDQEAMSWQLPSEGQRQDDVRIYGVPRAFLEERGPSVVCLNGILASVAVTEWMVDVTGIRRPSTTSFLRRNSGLPARGRVAR